MAEAVCVSDFCKTENKRSGEKQHSVIIALRIKKRLLLLLLGLFPLIVDDISGTWRIISAASFEILILLLILLRAILERENHRWIYTHGRLVEKHGILNKREIYVPAESISSASAVKSPLLSMFHAVKLEAGTAVSSRKPLSFYTAEANSGKFIRQVAFPSKDAVRFKAQRASVFITAMSLTNIVSGLLFMVPLFIKLRKVINTDLNLRLFGALAQKLTPYISYGAALIVGAAAAGWTAGFIIKCFNTGFFTLAADRKCIASAQGVIVRRLDCVRTDCVLCFDERETLLLKILKRKTMYGSFDGEKHLFLPSVKNREYDRIKRRILPPETKSAVRAAVPEKGKAGWYLPWALCLIAVMGISIRLCGTENIMNAVTVLLPVTVAFSWRTAVCYVCSGEAYIEAGSRYVSVRTAERMTIHTFTAFQGNVQKAQITVSPFQKGKGLCTVRIKIAGHKRMLRCRNLPENRVRAVIEKIRTA